MFLGLKAYSLPEIAPRSSGQLLGAATQRSVTAQNGIPWWYFQSHAGAARAARARRAWTPAG